MRRNPTWWQVIETMPDGDVVRVTTDVYAYAAMVCRDMRRLGYAARIEPAKGD